MSTALQALSSRPRVLLAAVALQVAGGALSYQQSTFVQRIADYGLSFEVMGAASLVTFGAVAAYLLAFLGDKPNLRFWCGAAMAAGLLTSLLMDVAAGGGLGSRPLIFTLALALAAAVPRLLGIASLCVLFRGLGAYRASAMAITLAVSDVVRIGLTVTQRGHGHFAAGAAVLLILIAAALVGLSNFPPLTEVRDPLTFSPSGPAPLDAPSAENRLALAMVVGAAVLLSLVRWQPTPYGAGSGVMWIPQATAILIAIVMLFSGSRSTLVGLCLTAAGFAALAAVRWPAASSSLFSAVAYGVAARARLILLFSLAADYARPAAFASRYGIMAAAVYVASSALAPYLFRPSFSADGLLSLPHGNLFILCAAGAALLLWLLPPAKPRNQGW